MSASVAGGGRPKGLPKTGGRKKGTPNRATVLLGEKLAANGYDPADELMRIAADVRTPLELSVHIHLALLPYIYPKRKPVDDSTREPMTANVTTILEPSGNCTNVPTESPSPS